MPGSSRELNERHKQFSLECKMWGREHQCARGRGQGKGAGEKHSS